MKLIKHLTLLLFIGLAWGKVNKDTSNIDYYKEGMIAAKKDFTDQKRFNGLIWYQSSLSNNESLQDGYQSSLWQKI